jgi:hypothetical protein
MNYATGYALGLSQANALASSACSTAEIDPATGWMIVGGMIAFAVASMLAIWWFTR